MPRNTTRFFRRPHATIVAASGILAGVVAVTTALSGCTAMLGGGGVLNTAGKVEFTNPLAVPPLAASSVDETGTRIFDLTAAAATTEFSPGVETSTWGFNQGYLGPTIVASRGEQVRVNVTNDLDEPTTVHWHGMHLPARMDGGPHQMVEPGDTWSPEWTIDQPAASLWYHPHPHEETEDHVEKGLAGMVILSDENERSLNLPRQYGIDDFPVIVQDKRFDSEGQFTTATRSFLGPIGDQVLVNGTPGAYLDVSTDVVRLRLLNASSARIYDFAFDDTREFELIASDGGLLAESVPLRGIRLSPGERAEVLVSLSPGEQVTLRSNPPDLGVPEPLSESNTGEDTLDVLQLRAAAELRSSGQRPTQLAELERMTEGDASATREFTLNGLQINGRPMDLGRIDETVKLGTTEIWAVRNAMSMPHSFHVHDVQFQVLTVDGEAPPPQLAGWKDTIYLEPDVQYRIIMTFADYSDRNHPYMYHCHLLAHEDSGMMGQFVVVRPGETAGDTPTSHHAAIPPTGRGPRTQEPSHDH